MTGNFKKLIESVQGDIVLIDMMYQWANTPTGTTAPIEHGQIPKHELIENNLMVRYNHKCNLDKNSANAYFEKFKKLVEEAGFDFNSGFNDAKWLVNEYVRYNPVLKLETLYRLASANNEEREIVWLFSKLKDQGLQWQWSSYTDSDAEREYSKKTFEKFRSLLKILFNRESLAGNIPRVLVYQGFINELESITSKKPFKRSGEYVFSSYLDDIAKNIDKHIKVTIFNEDKIITTN